MRAREEKGANCPFCSSPLARPRTIPVGIGRAEGGACACGARYLMDPTGKNVGELMLHALELMGKDLGKGPLDLAPGEDYDEIILSYDWRTHRSHGEPEGFMDGYGRLYVFRPKKDRP